MEEKAQVTSAQNQEQSLINKINMNSPFFTKKLILVLIVAVILGVGTGYMLANKKSGVDVANTDSLDSSEISIGMIVGSDYTKIFKDTAVGMLKGGGINGEGQFHLVRKGGDSQNVYLTSSIVDLNMFIGRKIKIWGETQKAQYAGWLMDVGRVEVLE